MILNSTFSRRANSTVKFGRRPKIPGIRRLFLQHYLKAIPPLPSLPITRSTGLSFPMDLNDSLEDCVEACKAHYITSATNWIQGPLLVPTTQDVLTCYERNGGYSPNSPSTDRGESMNESFNDLCTNGMAGVKAVAQAQVNVNDPQELSTAVWLFGGTPIGVQLPSNAITQFDNGAFNDTSEPPNPSMGHCILGIDVTSSGLNVVTWGQVIPATWAWIEKYADEAIAILWSQTQAISDANIDVQAWVADFQQLVGQNPSPSPVPPVPVPPTPVPPTPVPPTPSFDQVMQILEQMYANRPVVESWLRQIQALGDQVLATYSHDAVRLGQLLDQLDHTRAPANCIRRTVYTLHSKLLSMLMR